MTDKLKQYIVYVAYDEGVFFSETIYEATSEHALIRQFILNDGDSYNYNSDDDGSDSGSDNYDYNNTIDAKYIINSLYEKYYSELIEKITDENELNMMINAESYLKHFGYDEHIEESEIIGYHEGELEYLDSILQVLSNTYIDGDSAPEIGIVKLNMKKMITKKYNK